MGNICREQLRKILYFCGLVTHLLGEGTKIDKRERLLTLRSLSSLIYLQLAFYIGVLYITTLIGCYCSPTLLLGDKISTQRLSNSLAHQIPKFLHL